MDIEISYQARPGLSIIRKISDGQLVWVRGFNGVGKTLAATMLVIASGGHRFEHKREFESLKEALKYVNITIRISETIDFAVKLVPDGWRFLDETMMIEDMQHFQISSMNSPKGRILRDDARTCISMEKDWADLTITSPPYPNNYDYADATRLEMSFFGEIERWADLKNKVRRYLIRSCSQHMSSRDELDRLLKKKTLDPIKDELNSVCTLFERERFRHSAKKNYHLMIAAYFSDLADVWISLRRICKEGAKICFIVGDSAPYGIYIPVDKWLGELAKSAGFNSYIFEKIRDRNIKWTSNRKHKIPLKEGRLWVNG